MLLSSAAFYFIIIPLCSIFRGLASAIHTCIRFTLCVVFFAFPLKKAPILFIVQRALKVCLTFHIYTCSLNCMKTGMRNFLPFLFRDANSCIDCQPHKGCPRFAMNASIHFTHSFEFRAFFMEVFFTTVGFENGQNLKLSFEKNA